MNIDVTIDGDLKPIQTNIVITRALNARSTFRGDFVSEPPVYRAPLNKPIVVTRDSTDIFRGKTVSTRERGVGNVGLPPIAMEVSADDDSVLLERRFIVLDFPAGTTVDAIAAAFVVYLAPYGISLDPSQATGPAITEALTFDGVKLSDACSRVTDLTGWVRQLTFSKLFSFVEPGSEAAPFDITATNLYVMGDMTVERSRVGYANRVIVKAGEPGLKEKSQTFTGDGVLDTWSLANTIDGPIAYVPDGAIGYAVVDVSWGTTEPLGGLSSTLDWKFNPETLELQRTTGAVANLDTFTVRYQSMFPVIVFADNLAEQASEGIIEVSLERRDIFDRAQAQAVADAEVSKAASVLTTVYYDTLTPGLEPGQAQTITVAPRGLSGSWLIVEVRTTSLAKDYLRHSITAVGGDAYRGSWRDIFGKLFSLGSTSVAGRTSVTDPATVTVVDPETITEDVADQDVTLNAVITGAALIAAGTLTFTVKDGSTTIGSPVTVAVSAGAASSPYTIPGGTPSGTYTISAFYSGTPSLSASSDTDDLTVSPGATCTLVYQQDFEAGDGASMLSRFWSTLYSPFDSADGTYPYAVVAENVKTQAGVGVSGGTALVPYQNTGSPDAGVSAWYEEGYGSLTYGFWPAETGEVWADYYFDSGIPISYAPLFRVMAGMTGGTPGRPWYAAIELNVNNLGGGTYRLELVHDRWSNSNRTVQSYTFTQASIEGAWHRWKVEWKAGTVIAGPDVSTDGWIKVSLDGTVIYNETGQDLYFDTGGLHIARGVALGWYGLAGKVDTLHICTP